MPFDDGGKWYNSPEQATRFELAPTYITTNSTTAWGDVEDAVELHVTLGVHEFYLASVTGANNDLIWAARTPGTSDLTIAYVVSGTATPLSVVKATNDVTVYVATDSGGSATSTAQDVIDYVGDDEAASDVEQAIVVMLAPSNDGTGVISTSMSQQSLAGPGGSSPTLDVTFQASIDAGTTNETRATFTQVTGTATTQKKIISGLGTSGRFNLAVSGTSPTYVVSVGVNERRI